MVNTSRIKRGIAAVTSAFMLVTGTGQISFTDMVNAASARQVEKLSRGLTVTALGSGTLVSWRYLGTDTEDTVFKLYRNSELIYTSSQDMATCYKDAGGDTGSSYSLQVFKGGSSIAGETAEVEYILNYDSTGKGGYFDMELDRPTDTRLGAEYTPNDASVADLDGDGKYELIIKWDPSNSQDNSQTGQTSNVIIDAYKLEVGDSQRLWRIDLGQNIRAGAHYTQFMVYDFDGDGKAEMVCKTAPGSTDGGGSYVNLASSLSAIKNASDNTTAYADTNGRILSGSEYLTLFDGQTGKALDTIYYEPERGDISGWGKVNDGGNRVDRFLGCVAYLNGTTPSVVMCRGYYARSVLVAYNVVNKRLSKQWIFDTDSSGNSDYAGQGNHNLAAADVDGDGYDEIVYGSMTVDHNGKGLYSTGLKHGDALHVGDFLPNRSGLEVYQVHEETYGASLRDAKTGEIIQRWTAESDTGRGIADNIIAGNSEAEFCSTADNVIYNSAGTKVAEWSAVTKWNQNSLIYWDDDLEREVLDRSMIDDYPNGRIFTGQNVTYNNGSKSNMCITADIFGDWREEIVAPLSTGDGVRVYATPYETNYRIYTLMHNTQYRCGVAAENVGYNQPPHVDYWLGTGSALPDLPSVYAPGDAGELINVKAELTGEDIADGTYTSAFTVNSKFRLIATEEGNIVISPSTKTVGDRTITKFINLKVKGSPQTSAVEISAKEAGDLYIGVLSGNSSTARNLSVYDSNGTRLSILDAPVSGTETVELQKVTLPKADTYYIYSTAGSVYVYYIGSTAELNTFADEPDTETTTQTTVQEGVSHSFDNGTESSYYQISGNLSTGYGSITYNNDTISQCLKIESSTSIIFNAANDGNFTMVFNEVSAGSSIYIDGTKYIIPEDGILTVAVNEGQHTVKKASGSSYLFYMSLLGSSVVTETTTETTSADAWETTTVTATTTTTAAETTTEITTQTITVKAVNNVYSFDGLEGRLTDDSNYGGAYLNVTGTAVGDGENYVSFNNDGYAFVADSDTGTTSVFILPVADSGNKITVRGSFKMPAASTNWTLMQIHGTKKSGEQSEIVGIRTSGTTYNLRLMGNNESLINTGVVFKADELVSYTIVIDKVNNKAYLTIGNSTVSADINCGGITEIRFVTATGVKNLYVGETSVACMLLGDADDNNLVNEKDVSAILRYISGIESNINTVLADYNSDGDIDLKDCIDILSDIK